MVEKLSSEPGPTAFGWIRGLHERMDDALVAGEEPSTEAVSAFLRLALQHSHEIRSIEERRELRYLMRLWTSYLSVRGAPMAELDIDAPALTVPSAGPDVDPAVSALLDGRLEEREREEVLAYVSVADEDYLVFADTASILRELEEAGV